MKRYRPAQEVHGGPGFARMARRAGPQTLEALRQDTLAQQRAALDAAAGARPVDERDRESYDDYPVPASAKKHRRKK